MKIRLIHCLFSCLLLLLSAVIFFSCSNSDDDTDFVSVKPQSEYYYEHNAVTDTIYIESSGRWTVNGLPAWIKAEPSFGNNGDKFVITVSENISLDERSAEFIVNCGSAIAVVKVTQYGNIGTNNVEIGFGTANVSYIYNESTGSLSLVYKNGAVPKIERGKAFVLPAEYNYGIRVIESVSSSGTTKSHSSGDTLNIETSQGDMSDLFYAIDFALSMQAVGTMNSPMTRAADGTPVYSPISCGWYDEQGAYHEIYNESTRATYLVNQALWSFKKNFNGEYIYRGNNCSLIWDKCSFDASLDGLFFFDFGEKRISEVRKKGDLKKFSYTLTGNIGLDMLMRYNAQGSYSQGNDEIIKKNLHKTLEFKFRVGGVVIPIKVNTHLGKYDSFEADGNIDVTGGVNASYGLEAVVEWTPGGVTRSYTGNPEFNVYPLTVEAQAAAEAKVSFYPRIEVGIYNFLGPWFEPRPYLKEEIEAGLTASTDGENNYGWVAALYNGLDLRTGFDLDFCGLTTNVWTSDIYNVVKDSELFEAPKRIRKLTPDDNIEVENGESVKAEFIVESYSPVNDKYYPCPLALVNFKPDCGEVDEEFVNTDANGKAYVEWTPKPATTRAEGMVERELKAVLVDKNCSTIDEATLTVEIEDANACNDANHVHAVDLGLSVKWACCNVGATKPEEYGGYYAWGETEEKSDYDWDTYKWCNGEDFTKYCVHKSCGTVDNKTVLDPADDVAHVKWGGSWRMPTRDEIDELVDECNWQWTSLNGVEGHRGTGPNGNSIFLPAAGFRYGTELYDRGAYGYYWSSSSTYGYCNDAYGLGFYDGDFGWYGHRYYGYSVRPVSK